MSRSLLHDWECDIDRCCRDDNPKEMISIAEDIYNTAYARGKNHSDVTEVLDKIRAEIAELSHYYPMGHDYQIAITRCLAVIDKYKGESEKNNVT